MKSDSSQNDIRCLKSFGVQLRKRRKSWGMSQRGLADRCGSTQSTIARIEAGVANPTTQTLEEIAHALNQDLLINFIPKRR